MEGNMNEEDMQRCPSCDAEVDDDEMECPECGEILLPVDIDEDDKEVVENEPRKKKQGSDLMEEMGLGVLGNMVEKKVLSTVEEMEKRLEEEKKFLEGQIEEQKREMKKIEREAEQHRKELHDEYKEEREKLQREYEEKKKELESELDEQSEKIDSLEKESREQREELLEKYEDEKKELEEKLNIQRDKIDDLEQKALEQKEELLEKYEREKKELEKELKDQADKINELEKKSMQQKEELRQEFDSGRDDLKKELKEEIVRTRDGLEQEREREKELLEKDIESLKTRFEEELEGMRERHQEQMEVFKSMAERSEGDGPGLPGSQALDLENELKQPVYPFPAIVGQERMKRSLLLNAINPDIRGVLLWGPGGSAKKTAVLGLAELLSEMEDVDKDEVKVWTDPERYMTGAVATSKANVNYIIDNELRNGALSTKTIDKNGSPTMVVSSPDAVDRRLISYMDQFSLHVKVDPLEDMDKRMEVSRRNSEFRRDPERFREDYQGEMDSLRDRIIQTRQRLPSVKVDSRQRSTIARVCAQNELPSDMDISIQEISRTIAAYDDRDEVLDEDIQEALDLALIHRVTETLTEEV